MDKKANKSCLWFRASIDVVVQIKGKNDTVIPLNGKNLETTGTCSNLTKINETSDIVMKWDGLKINITFMAGASKTWFFRMIEATYSSPKAALNGALMAEKIFDEMENSQYLQAEQNYAYSCEQREQVMLVSNNATQYNITLNINKIEVQPFTNSYNQTQNFDSCSSTSSPSKSSSIVPIAVGCALAGLIVIVLIAYLIGKRKGDGRGYQQV